ncbi:ATP-binding protein [Variovorax sp. OK605]|uniref:ATP-binding protein n=1 Tax=Variovorax sp. OK605 TaxID=1855317 RepID=UPI000B81C688|nr:ATP-binding protein [Variovorax sp. OK605]
MLTTTVFGGGVHGVGKTSLFASLATALHFIHWTASDLIRAEKASAIQGDSKAVRDIEGNQDLVVLGFRRAAMNVQGTILLDGHFTLLNTRGEIEDVPLRTFAALGSAGLVCISDKPALIRDRLLGRDGRAPAEQAIADHQNREQAAARRVALALGIPLCEVSLEDRVTLTDFLAGYGSTDVVPTGS